MNYCLTCSHLCEECSKAHKRLKICEDHELVQGVSDTKILVSERKKIYHCSIHPEERLKLYCKTCCSLVCLLCFVASHNGHDIGTINNTSRKEAEGDIRELIEVTQSKLLEFEENWGYIKNVEKDTTSQLAPLKVEMNKKFDFLIAQLEKRRTILLNEVDDIFTTDLKQVWAEKDSHERAIASLQGALRFARRSLDCKEDTELLALCSQVISRLETLSQMEVTSKATERVGITTVAFSEGDKGQEAAKSVENFGEVNSTTSRAVVEITTHDVPTAVERGEEISFRVSAVLKLEGKVRQRKHMELGCSVARELNNCVSPTRECAVEQNTTNSWTVKTTPSGSGECTFYLEASVEYGEASLTGDSMVTCRVRKPALMAQRKLVVW